jgi:phage terminase small subunit
MDLTRQRLRVATPPPPEHLEPPESQLWNDLHAEYKLRDASALALLASTLEAQARCRKCRTAIDRDGETTVDRWGQVKPHPLLAAERDARAAFQAGMRLLGLDIGRNS